MLHLNYFTFHFKVLLINYNLFIMTSKNSFTVQSIDYGSLGKRMLIGGIIALVLIIAFLYPVFGNPNPDWGKLWMIRPLIVVPLAGAAGGACNYFLIQLTRNGFNVTVAYLLSFIVYIIGLWMGTVLGLAGTLWD